MSTKKRNATSPQFWWDSAIDTFDKIVSEFLKRAKKADKREYGHDCGHEFTIRVEMRGHSSSNGIEPNEIHSDSNYTDHLVPAVVRARSLKAALLLAADRPFHEWFPDEDEEATDELLANIDGSEVTEHGL